MRRAAKTALLGAGFIVAAGLLDAEPFYVPGVAFIVLGVLCAAWVAIAAMGVRVQRTLDGRRVVEDQPLAARVVARAGGAAIPGRRGRRAAGRTGGRLPSGRQRFASGCTRRSPAGAGASSRPRGSWSATRSGWPRGRQRWERPIRCSCSRRTEPVRGSRRRARRRPRRRSAAAGRGGRDRDRRTADVPRGHVGVADPLAGARSPARPARAQAPGRDRQPPARRARRAAGGGG